jgi:hypothetical protein
MISIDCPFCTGHAQVDGALETVSCDGCGVTVEVAPDSSDAHDLAA